MNNQDYRPTELRIFFIGLGVMGYPMAGHLQRKCRQVTVFNRNSQKTLQWKEKFGGSVSFDIAEAQSANVIITCVSDDDALNEIFLGHHNLLDRLNANTIIIDHSTVSATITRHIFNQALSRKIHFLDAPVSGGQSGAEKGILTSMIGGDEDIFDQVKSLLSDYCKNTVYIGPTASGQLAKMVNQICIAGVIQGLAEGLSFAKNAGIDPFRVIKAIEQGAAASWQLQNRATTMVNNQFNFGFAVNLMKKDLMICMNEAAKNKSSLPITGLISQFYTQLQQQNDGHLDTSSLIKLLLTD